MSILSKLRASRWYQKRRTVRRTKAIIRSAEDQTRPLFDLGTALLTAALTCAEALKPDINPEQDPDKWVYVCFEFVYFFMHLVNRSAFLNLGIERRTHFMNDLGPMVVKGGIVEGFFGHWPEKYKVGIEKDFYEKLDATELEYANCQGLLSKEDDPATANSLIITLARNVANLMGKPLEPVIMIQTANTVAAQIQALNLNKLVKAAGAANPQWRGAISP